MAGPATWDQTAALEEGVDSDFDAVSPVWDQEADLEENDTSDFVTTNGTPTVSTDSALLGTYGMEAEYDGVDYGEFITNVTNETHVVVEFRFDPNGATYSGADPFVPICSLYVTTTERVFIRLEPDSAATGHELSFFVQDDVGGFSVAYRGLEISDAPHYIRIIWGAATSAGADNGYFYAFVDGVYISAASASTINNDTHNIDIIRYGTTGVHQQFTAGTLYFDEMKWSDGAGAPPWIIPAAQMGGTYGMGHTAFADTTAQYAELTGPTADTVATIKFDFDPNSITMATNDEFVIFEVVDEFFLSLKYTGSVYQLIATVDKDSGTTVGTAFTLTDAPHSIELAWTASTSAGANSGYLNVYVDDSLEDTITGVDNDTLSYDEARWGMVSGLDTGTTGVVFFDDMNWTDNGDFYPVPIGSITNTGAVVKQTNKIFAGVITKTGALLLQTNKIVAGVITNNGTLLKQINKVVAGAITNTGSLKSIRRLVIDFLMDVGIVSDTVLDVALVNEDDPEGRV